jgi:hypothetical protein
MNLVLALPLLVPSPLTILLLPVRAALLSRLSRLRLPLDLPVSWLLLVGLLLALSLLTSFFWHCSSPCGSRWFGLGFRI